MYIKYGGKNIYSSSRLFIDNSSVVGAGRALYETVPDLYDCISLMHLISAMFQPNEARPQDARVSERTLPAFSAT